MRLPARTGLARVRRRLRPPRRTVRLRLTLLYSGLFLVSGAGLLAITYLLVAHRITGPFSVSSESTPPSTAVSSGASGGASTHPISEQLRDRSSADLHQYLVQSGIALLIMAAASVVLGWFVAGRILRPLRTITQATRQISEENLHERLAVQSPPDELNDLGHTINGLLERLDTAFDAQRRFVANASHELRTPLTVSRAMLQVSLADPHLTLASLRATCDDLLAAQDEQEELIEALLTLARSQRGLDHRDRLDLAVVVRDVLRTRAERATGRRIGIDTTLNPAPFLGDVRLAERLVANLVDNALHYNDPNGQIQVNVTASSRQASLRIANNTGPPVTTDQIERLLQPFQRLTEHRRSNRNGAGLGLSIVTAIAQAHDATLDIRPGEPGGLDIEVRFPPVGS
jgi:signal transduction histidine kinase